MIIEKTNIHDITEDTIEESKIDLANNIMKNVYPLFDDVFTERKNELQSLEKILSKKKIEVLEKKEELETLLNEQKRKQKVNQLVSKISNLVSSGLVYDGNLKNETVITLKILPKLSSERLDYQLKEISKIISKRFPKGKIVS